MRICIRPRHRLAMLSYSAEIGRDVSIIRQGNWVTGTLNNYSEWRLPWVSGDELVIRIPLFRPLVSPEWTISLGGELICQGALRQGFWPSRKDGIYWQCEGETFYDGGLRSLRFPHALRNEDGVLAACWKPVCYGAKGVIRSSRSDIAMAAVLGIVATSVLQHDT